MVALPGRRHCPAWTGTPQWREMTGDPTDRRVLVTDGRGAVGQAMARGLGGAGASVVLSASPRHGSRSPARTAACASPRCASCLDIDKRAPGGWRPTRRQGRHPGQHRRARPARRDSDARRRATAREEVEAAISGRCAWRRRSARRCGRAAPTARSPAGLGERAVGRGAGEPARASRRAAQRRRRRWRCRRPCARELRRGGIRVVDALVRAARRRVAPGRPAAEGGARAPSPARSSRALRDGVEDVAVGDVARGRLHSAGAMTRRLCERERSG